MAQWTLCRGLHSSRTFCCVLGDGHSPYGRRVSVWVSNLNHSTVAEQILSNSLQVMPISLLRTQRGLFRLEKKWKHLDLFKTLWWLWKQWDITWYFILFSDRAGPSWVHLPPASGSQQATGHPAALLCSTSPSRTAAWTSGTCWTELTSPPWTRVCPPAPITAVFPYQVTSKSGWFT